MQRRGLSDVIATVLTILIVLMAIIIAWNFLQPVLNKIGLLSTSQFTTKLSVPQESLVLDQGGKQLSFSVKRDQGEGEITGFIFGLKDPEGNVRTFRQNISISELELRGFVVNYSEYAIDDVVSISVTPIFRNNQTGLEQNGNPIDQKIKQENKVNKTVVTPPYQLPNGLVVHWRFDGNWVDSVNQLNGAVVGGATFDTNNKKFGSASGIFPGQSTAYITVPTDPILNPSTFTIIAWVNPKSFYPSSANNIYTKFNPSGGFALIHSPKYNYWQFNTRGVTNSLNISESSSLNSWNFIAASIDSAGQKTLYYNSNSASTTVSSYAPSTTTPVTIGSYFNGTIDEIMFFNRALTTQEISDIRTKYKG